MKLIRSLVCIWLVSLLGACAALTENRQPEIIVPANIKTVSISIPKNQNIDQFKNNALGELQYPGLRNYPPRNGAPSYSRWGYRVYPQKNGMLHVLKIKGGITDATRAEKVGYIKYTVDKKIEDKGEYWLVQFEPIKKEYYTPFDLLQSDYVVNSFEIDELNKVLANTFFTYTYEVDSKYDPSELIKSLLRSGVNVQQVDKDENMDRASASGDIQLQGEVTSLSGNASVNFSVNVLPTKLGSKSTFKLKVPFLYNEQLHFDLNKTISNLNNQLNSIAGN